MWSSLIGVCAGTSRRTRRGVGSGWNEAVTPTPFALNAQLWDESIVSPNYVLDDKKLLVLPVTSQLASSFTFTQLILILTSLNIIPDF